MSEQLYQCVSADVKLGAGVKLGKFINLYGCTIGDESRIGAFVEIQKNAFIWKRCKISSHTFICEGVAIGDNCFIGHSVVFINDKHPRSVTKENQLEGDKDWRDRFIKTSIGNNVSIGSNATILGGITIGDGALIGAAPVVATLSGRTVVVSLPASLLEGSSHAILGASATRRGVWRFHTAWRDIELVRSL
jgi:acetyltransferase-like isoleucine patch superfamily enzyme